jgi:hypothetical protein
MPKHVGNLENKDMRAFFFDEILLFKNKNFAINFL